jgi:two-component sensor histidine kinase
MPDSLPYTPTLEGRTLLDELNHRIKNELASVINLVTFKAVWTDNVEAKEELSNVVDLLHQHVQIHSILTMPDGDTLADAGEQLRKLGLAMSRCKLDRMNIRLVLAAETLPLESERCWRLALAVYELVTNAVRHACFDGRDGEIKISLMRAGSWSTAASPTTARALEGSSLVAACGSWASWRAAWVSASIAAPARCGIRSRSTFLWRSENSAPTARSPPAAREPIVD